MDLGKRSQFSAESIFIHPHIRELTRETLPHRFIVVRTGEGLVYMAAPVTNHGREMGRISEPLHVSYYYEEVLPQVKTYPFSQNLVCTAEIDRINGNLDFYRIIYDDLSRRPIISQRRWEVLKEKLTEYECYR